MESSKKLFYLLCCLLIVGTGNVLLQLGPANKWLPLCGSITNACLVGWLVGRLE